MVKHTHQDCLAQASGDTPQQPLRKSVDISKIRDFREEQELFDIPGKSFRKVNISYLDEHLDSAADWELFISPLIGIDRLYIIDDRVIINPIMKQYAEDRNSRYLSYLFEKGLPATII